MSVGHIDESAVALITVVGLVTIGISTYMILNSHARFDRLAPLLRRFERHDHKQIAIEHPEPYDAIVYLPCLVSMWMKNRA